jgi:hypothetical protein
MTKIRVILKKTMPLAVRLYVIGRGKALEISVALADSTKASRMKRFFPNFMPRRNLERDPYQVHENHSARRLNLLMDCISNVTTYLEVGVAAGRTFEAVRVPFKWGVDPIPQFNPYFLPVGSRFSVAFSDSFFEGLQKNISFDLIFLDGLHQWEQTYKDLINVFSHSNLQTLVLMDDVIPVDEFSSWRDHHEALEARKAFGGTSLNWNGDIFKVLLALRDYHPELDWCVINQEPNPQAVIWKKREVDTVSLLAPFDVYDSVTYKDLFKDGTPPNWFNCVDEGEAINRARMQNQLKKRLET